MVVNKDDELMVVELCLCETEHLVLRPHQLYYFVVDEDCARCKELAALSAPPQRVCQVATGDS